MRESARQDAIAVLRAAERRAVEDRARGDASARGTPRPRSTGLQKLESDLRDRLRDTLEAVIGKDETAARRRTIDAAEHSPSSE